MMKIGNVGNMNTAMQAGMSRGTDGTAKNIQSQIANTQKQLQQLSENSEMSVEEKIKKRQEINQQMIELNSQLRQHQIKQQREKQEDKKSSGDDMLGGKNKMNKRTSNGKSGGLSQASMKAMISADSAVSQAEVQGSVASKMDGRAGVLKAEIKQDAGRGAVGGKKEELAEVEQKAMVATNAQMATLSEANKELEAAAKEDRMGPEGEKTSEKSVLDKNKKPDGEIIDIRL